jgi:hypothetical protein
MICSPISLASAVAFHGRDGRAGARRIRRGPRGRAGPRQAGRDAAPAAVAPPAVATAGGGRGGATTDVRRRGVPGDAAVRPAGGRWGHRRHARPDLAFISAPRSMPPCASLTERFLPLTAALPSPRKEEDAGHQAPHLLCRPLH